MRDSNKEMVKLINCGKINDRYFARVSIHIDFKEIKLKFGIDRDSYIAFRRAIEYRPFDNFTNQPYFHYFAGSFNKHTNEMVIRVEQGNNHKQFWIKSSWRLITSLRWILENHEIDKIQYLLDLNDDEMFEKMKTFTAEKTGVDKNILNRQTMIEKDCGIKGRVTRDFYDQFFKKFNVCLPNGFSYKTYIESEPFELFKFIKGLFAKKQENKIDKIDLTLGELEQAVLTGEWREIN